MNESSDKYKAEKKGCCLGCFLAITGYIMVYIVIGAVVSTLPPGPESIEQAGEIGGTIGLYGFSSVAILAVLSSYVLYREEKKKMQEEAKNPPQEEQ